MTLLLFVVVGCSDLTTAPSRAPASATRAPIGSVPAESDAAEPGTETEEPADSLDATDEPAASNQASPESDDPFVGRVVVSLVDRLRLRAEAGTDAQSLRSLPLSTALFVLDGPRDASGYAWYQVVPMVGGTASSVGWVAAASLQGTPWLETAEADCPATPETFEELRALSPGERVACFGQTPLSVAARLVVCDCDIDAPAFDPPWFGLTLEDGAPVLLVDPAMKGPVEAAQGLVFVVDPAAEVEDPLPVGELVDVTGVFDHSAARGCTSETDGESQPDVSCRFAFAVTSLQAAAS